MASACGRNIRLTPGGALRMRPGDLEFEFDTQLRALNRQNLRCASCGTAIKALGEPGRAAHEYGEIAHAHHMKHAKFRDDDHPATLEKLRHVDNCVILCITCHYSAHEGGNYRYGTV